MSLVVCQAIAPCQDDAWLHVSIMPVYPPMTWPPSRYTGAVAPGPVTGAVAPGPVTPSRRAVSSQCSKKEI